jgi:acetate kinase
MRVLVVNAGSSSLKLTLLDADDRIAWSREIAAPGAVVDSGAVARALAELPKAPNVVGHRVVHGGERFRSAVWVDEHVLSSLHELTALAPLHQPKSLAAIAAVADALPGAPAVACFDTAFHATLPAAASTYALPRAWRERHGVRRYGFHGLSHAYAARQAAGVRRVVTCHLGAGASLCAVLDGESVDTTMGFTPLDGLVMATRSGSVDPGLLLWLQRSEGIDVDAMAEALEHGSGLLALAGTADMREVLMRDDDDARLALDVYLHSLRSSIGAMTATLGGLDTIVFTGGVGERSAPIRARACAGLRHLGIAIDAARNDAVVGDADISAADAAARVLVVQAREDVEIARQARKVVLDATTMRDSYGSTRRPTPDGSARSPA